MHGATRDKRGVPALRLQKEPEVSCPTAWLMLRKGCQATHQSMIRRGDCQDNAHAESFLDALRRELEGLYGEHPAAWARQSVFMHIEAYYNRVRAHSTIDHFAPDVFQFCEAT